MLDWVPALRQSRNGCCGPALPGPREKLLSSTTLNQSPHFRVRTTIRTIVFVIGILLVAMWAVVGGSIIATRQQALDHIEAEARNLAAAFSDEVTHILDGVAAGMEVVAERMRAGRNLLDVYRDLPLPQLATIQGVVIAPDGMLAATTLDPNPKPLDLSDREHFRIHLDGRFKGIFIGKPVTGRLSKQITIQVSRRVDAADGTFLGVIVFALSPGQLTSLHKTIDLGPHGVIVLTGLDNVIRARFTRESPDGLAGLGQSIAGASRPAEFAESASGFYVRKGVVDGIERLLGYRRVGNYPLVATVGLDLDEALAPFYRYAATTVALALAATLLLIGLAAYLIREIRIRAARDVVLEATNIALAEERTKLLATNIALAESKERAEAASEAKSLFLANMSHELRTPLNAIIGYSEIIRDQIFGANAVAQYTEYAGDIYNSGHHLLTLIIDILDTAKIDAGKFELEDEIVDLAVLIDLSVAQVRLAIESKRLGLELTIPDGLPRVRADASRLKQVLINLLSNAVKFTPEGGHIRVGVRCSAEGETICEVSDTGIGMSSEDIAVALEPFSQVENGLTKSYDGTGLGLPLAQRLVELHGGIMEIESAKGCGTTVRVRLPAERTVTGRYEKIHAAHAMI